MTSVVVLAVTLLLTLVATAGIVPALRRPAPAIEPIPEDRLEEQRLALLRSLRDLDASHHDGAIGDDEYTAVRTRTEERLARVLAAMDRRRSE